MAHPTHGDSIYVVRRQPGPVAMKLTAWWRLLVAVSGAYKQMKLQSENVLSDIGEDSIDRAFKLLRPGEPSR